jgi:hypothetical protein
MQGWKVNETDILIQLCTKLIESIHVRDHFVRRQFVQKAVRGTVRSGLYNVLTKTFSPKTKT